MTEFAIEENLVRDMKLKGLFERYYDALEYVCVFRYFMNTFRHAIYKVRPIPWDKVKHIKKFMKENYPDFMKNKYLQEHNWKYRFWLRMAYFFPRGFASIFPAYKFLRHNVLKKKLIGR